MDADLLERPDIKKGERAALRASARAVDLGEAVADPDLITRANDGYLRLRISAGLTSGGAKPADAFDELLAQLAAPGASDPAQP